MAFIGDGDQAAPRLSDVDLDLVTARRVWRELQRDIQRMLDGGVVLDVTVSSAVFNTGLPDSVFSLP